MESGTLTKVINDFFTTVDGELSLSKGDYFLISDVIDKHWCYGESCHKTGRFPANHLHKVDIPNIKESEKLYVSIAPFRGEQHGDLSFGKGELIVGEHEVDSDWYSGKIDSRSGVFPSSYVWLLDPSILKKPTDKKSVRKKAKVKASLMAQLDEELDLTEGEIVTVLEILDDGWVLAITEDQRSGTCPEGFLTYIEENPSDELDEAAAMSSLPESITSGGKIYKDFGEAVVSTHHAEEPAPSYYDLFPEAPKPEISIESPESENDNLNPLGVNPYAITLYPFNAQFPNELNFGAGEVIHLIKHIDTEWAEGKIDDEIGIFPTSYVNIIVNCSEIPKEVSPQKTTESFRGGPLNAGDQVKVEHTFHAQMNGDLSVNENETVTVVEMANDDWVSVRNNHGDVGLCPRGYLSQQCQSPLVMEHDPLEDFVVIRNHEKNSNADEERPKRLSEPHRPAPPAPAPGSIPLQKQSVTEKSSESEHIDEAELEKQKRADKRQNVITELVLTEKEYVRDLKVTYETFNLYDPSALEARGIDATLLFGNILEVIHVAEELLDSILKAMKGRDENCQEISPCFLKMTEQLKTVYGKYCGNHEAALSLLKKYEENRDIMIVFEKGIETLRHQVVCFDMSSILIKPVQRILKYPLMLYELIKCTEDGHPDKAGIEAAWKAMTDVASHINEYKRRKDLVSKYLDNDNTLMRKMAKLNMHSVAKMSSRLSARLSATLGLTNIPADTNFEELERQFKSLEKCIWQLAADVEQCVNYLNEEAICGELLSNFLNQYHYGVVDREVERYNKIRVQILSQFIQTLKDTIERRVNQPINSLIVLLDGPVTLINKRHDKLLDYDNAISKSEKYKDSRVVQEELANTKKNYEALNEQLLEELPVFIDAATKILVTCIGAFANARKLFNGKIMKRYLQLSESATQVTAEDILQSFLINHNLLWNQISRFSFAGVNPKVDEATVDVSPQSERQRAALMNKQPRDRLFVVRENVISTSLLDLGASKGTVVAVIKMQDPMGDSSRWFVDNGTAKGFIPRNSLEPLPQPRTLTQNNNDVVDSRTSTPDLMSSNTPEKEIKDNLITLDSPVKEKSCVDSQSRWYLNVDNGNNDNQNYQNVPTNADSRYENSESQFYFAEYNFDGKMPGTLAVKKGQVLKLIRPFDEKRNTAWWLMEDRDGNDGYVPSNYLNILQNSGR